MPNIHTEQSTTLNLGDDLVFYTADEVMDHTRAVEQHKDAKTPASIRSHFITDWSSCETLARLEMSPIRPIATLELGREIRHIGRSYNLFVECDEGLVSVEEIRMAGAGSEMVPTPCEIASRTKEVRSHWVDGLQREYHADSTFG